MPRFLIWIHAARPRTLTAALIPVLVGSALAFSETHSLNAVIFACTLFSALLIQVGTNLVNDAEDFKRGADTAERVGPMRVTQAGLLKADEVLRGAFVCFGLAFLLGIPLIMAGGWTLLFIGLASIIAAYAYTGGPYPLAYLGLGDLFVLIFFGEVAVGGTYFLQTGRWSLLAALCGLAVGALATILLAVNNLRDHVTDRVHNKKTLAVRFGTRFARLEIAVCAGLPFLLLLWMISQGFLGALLPCLAAPLAGRVVWLAYHREGGDLNQALAASAGLHALYGVLLALGLCVPHV